MESLCSREQEENRAAKADEEIALYNTKKRRIIYSRVRFTMNVAFFLCCYSALFGRGVSQARVFVPQDDSDDDPPVVKRSHGRSDALDFIDLSCEEGEETASSHTEVWPCPLSDL